MADGGGVLGVPSDPEQLDLLRDDKGRLPGNVFQLMRAQGRKAGRPPGAGNKRNETLAKLVCNQSGDPVLFMASLYSMPLDQLVELLKLAAPGDGKLKSGDLAVEALKVQLTAAREVSQYVHSKKPVEVQASGSVDFRAIVVGGNAPADPGPQVQRNLVDAINSGVIGERDLAAIRVIDGDFHVVDDDDEGAA